MSSGNKAGGLALYGGGGLLTSDAGLSWDSQSGTLTVPRLQATEVSGHSPRTYGEKRLAAAD